MNARLCNPVSGWRILLSAAVIASGCGLDGQESSLDLETELSSIIGGTSVSVQQRRQLGLVDVNGPACSGSLIHRNWVLTNAHCVTFTSPTSNTFAIPKANGTLESRSAIVVEQVGTADIALAWLADTVPGSEWPSVTRLMGTGAPNTVVGQNVTCYGKGATQYNTPSGTGVSGSGWRALTRRVERQQSGDLVILSDSAGSQIIAPGDSGGPCLLNDRTTAVIRGAGVSCLDETNETTCAQTITRINEGYLRSTVEFANYIDQAPLRTSTTNFQPANEFGSTNLVLVNGWTNHPSATNNAAVALFGNVVHLRGAISTTGTAPLAFQLPSGRRPSAEVYIPVTLCSSTKGRLRIQSSGTVEVQAEGGIWSNAQCLTSLDGASFAVGAAGSQALPLVNGWTNAPFGTRAAAVRNLDGIVRFQGAISGGTTATPFSLPAGFRPNALVYVPVDMCDATKGRLIIDANGTVTLQGFSGFWTAQCFTSLEGASFAVDATGFSGVTFLNGWTNYSTATRAPMVKNVGGIIHFQGAIRTSGSSGASTAFQLPLNMRPATNVLIPIDLCHAQKGRMYVNSSGNVTIQTITGGWSAAQCFTSLEGAWFGL